jgi:hypothetical protein
MALLGGAFGGMVVMDFALFSVAVHPMELCVGSFFFTRSLLSVNVGVRRKEVGLLKIPVGFLK